MVKTPNASLASEHRLLALADNIRDEVMGMEPRVSIPISPGLKQTIVASQTQ